MNLEERNKKMYEIYAALGELSVLKKQTEQRSNHINSQIEEYEQKLINLLQEKLTTTDEALQTKGDVE